MKSHSEVEVLPVLKRDIGKVLLGALLFTGAYFPAIAADVTIRIVGTSGGTASVFLDGDSKRWAGTNDNPGDLLKARSGSYKAGTNVVPGFAVKGTGLLVGVDGREVEAFLYNLIPAEAHAGATGDVHLLGMTTTGKWTVR
ncbi:hypothetical protein [Rhizobium sp. Leaf371]|uniref:hypothetical protein n=1 Tax=Rhizobium sp. Leaf371 TaxID=1736355 RepID=UPI0012E94488|nr:hypothetical protein [Rhizobium sp. Leaf371]